MAAVSLLRVGYEKKLRDEHDRRRAAEEEWRRVDGERTQLLRERDALRRILGSTVGGRRERSERNCQRHSRPSTGRSRSSEAGRPFGRTLEARVKQLREQISSQRRLLAEMENELRVRDGTIVAMQAEEGAWRDRERVLVERLREAVEMKEGGEETERILRAELDYAQSRLAAFAVSSPSRSRLQLLHSPLSAAAAEGWNAAAPVFDAAANEGVLQRLQEVTQLLQENEERTEEQRRLLEEMGEQMNLVMAEREEAMERARKMEIKYQKAKSDVIRLRDTVERLTDSADPSGRLSEGKSELERARERHAQREREREAAAAADAERKEWRDRSDSSLEYYQLLLNLVEDEKAIARSLHEDLDVTRKMLLERDASVHALAAELSDARISLSAAATEVEMERGRAEERAAAAERDGGVYEEALMAREGEIHGLRLRLADALRQCASFSAKLEAQGRDLVAVKKELQRLQLS